MVTKKLGAILLTCCTLVCLFIAGCPLEYGNLTNHHLAGVCLQAKSGFLWGTRTSPLLPGELDRAKKPSSLFSTGSQSPCPNPPGGAGRPSPGDLVTGLDLVSFPMKENRRQIGAPELSSGWHQWNKEAEGTYRAWNSSHTKTQENPPALGNSHTFFSY